MLHKAVLNLWMETWPDRVLTWALLVVAALLVLVALQRNQTLVKAIVLAWVVIP